MGEQVKNPKDKDIEEKRAGDKPLGEEIQKRPDKTDESPEEWDEGGES